MRVLASHQCDPGSNPGVDIMKWIEFLLVFSVASSGFSLDTPFSPSPQKPILPTFHSIWSTCQIHLYELLRTSKCFVGKKNTVTTQKSWKVSLPIFRDCC